MCGISVLITQSLNKDKLNEFQKLLKRQEQRGGDSVGIWVGSKKESRIIYSLSKSSDNCMNALKRFIEKRELLNKPVILLGHTRATATGTNKDYHPALSETKNSLMIHNGVVYDSEGYYYHPNDTYHLVNVLDLEGETRGERKQIRKRMTTGGSTIFYYNNEKGMLEFNVQGHTPLLGKQTKEDLFFCSVAPIILNKEYKDVKEGFYKIDVSKELFEKNKGDGILFIDNTRYIRDTFNRQFFNIVNRGTNINVWDCPYLDYGYCEQCDTCIHKERPKHVYNPDFRWYNWK
jgi:hypothetical protein